MYIAIHKSHVFSIDYKKILKEQFKFPIHVAWGYHELNTGLSGCVCGVVYSTRLYHIYIYMKTASRDSLRL